MAVYRSRNALAGPLTPDRIAAVELPRALLCRHGYRLDDVHALLHRLAFELGERSRQLDQVRAENQRIKHALRAWQTYQAAQQGDALTVALDHYRPDQEVYLCGPPLMLAGSRLRLLTAGVPTERIHLPETMGH